MHEDNNLIDMNCRVQPSHNRSINVKNIAEFFAIPSDNFPDLSSQAGNFSQLVVGVMHKSRKMRRVPHAIIDQHLNKDGCEQYLKKGFLFQGE